MEQQGSPIGTEKNPLVVKPEPFEKPLDLVSWQAPSRVYKNRKPVWFVGVILLSIVVLFLLVLTTQWTLFLAILAFLITLFLTNIIEPAGQSYTITTYGIKIGSKHTSYADLKWFWFEDDNDISILYISTFLHLPHIFEIPLPYENTKEIRETIEDELLKYLPYHEEGEHNWWNTLDNLVARIEPWLPQSLINFYTRTLHREKSV